MMQKYSIKKILYRQYAEYLWKYGLLLFQAGGTKLPKENDFFLNYVYL